MNIYIFFIISFSLKAEFSSLTENLPLENCTLFKSLLIKKRNSCNLLNTIDSLIFIHIYKDITIIFIFLILQ
jgi:hypothetical protein